MRDIKFRGKRKDNGEWVYGDVIHDIAECNTTRICIEREYSTGTTFVGNAPMVDYKTIGQYTGLRDKNGKEIYEGDIIKAEHIINHVIKLHKPRGSYGGEEYTRDYDFARCYRYFRNYAIKFNVEKQRLEARNGSDGHYISCYFINAHKVEVIGNIYDNPELLEGK